MKLSMWILANQLSTFDPQLSLRPDSPMVLRSARTTYATNCVVVRQEGENCLCTFEEDSLTLWGVNAQEGMNLIQGVFDEMSDWYSAIAVAAAAQDYQTLVDMCHRVFHNPLILENEDHRTLGISSQYGADAVDEEWRYLKTYGYVSLRAIRNAENANHRVAVSNEVVRVQFFKPGRCRGSLTTRIFHNGAAVGRLSILEVDRPINQGDLQVVEQIASLLAASLSTLPAGNDISIPYLSKLMDGIPIGAAAWQHLKGLMGWQSGDLYRLYAFWGEDGVYTALQNILSDPRTKTLPAPSDHLLFTLVNETVSDGPTQRQRLLELAKGNRLTLFGSLPASGAVSIPALVQQIQYMSEKHPRRTLMFYDFSQYAVDFLLSGTSTPAALLAACHPDVQMLYKMRSEGEAMPYETLYAYLTRERSVTETAAALYIHKNTLLYRLHKLNALLTADLSDPDQRLHLLLSFRILSRYGEK